VRLLDKLNICKTIGSLRIGIVSYNAHIRKIPLLPGSQRELVEDIYT
jgi:hypothetical protein